MQNYISNQKLLDNYLTLEMQNYFYKKCHNEKEEYVKLKIVELLKFLTLSHHTYGDIPFNDEIDEMWHLWILQTVQYKELMNKLPGKKFINHCSNDYNDSTFKIVESDETKLNQQISFLVSYVVNFGPFTSDTISFWPATKTLMKSLDFTLDQLNQFLMNLTAESA